MSRKKNDISEKIEEIRSILETYNGVPGQKENRVGYTTVKYYVTHWGDDPRIKSLIEQYNIKFTNRVVRTYDEKLAIVKSILEDYQKVPSIKDEPQNYSLIRDFFRTQKGNYEVDYLRYVYGSESCWPIPNTKYKDRPDSGWSNFGGASGEWLDWRSAVDFEYVEYVYTHFGVLPAEKTRPMVRINSHIDKWNRYGHEMWGRVKEPFLTFVKTMIELGCEDERFTTLYGSIIFREDTVQERVRQMVIENGACSVHYIAQTAIPNYPLSDRFVYYYYHNLLRGHITSIPRHPMLSIVPSGVDFESRSILTVHYQDYHKCDIQKIRHLAQQCCRNWIESPPQNMGEWKSLGHCFFFHSTINRDFNIEGYKIREEVVFDWNKTLIQHAFDNGLAYFEYKYCKKEDRNDYCLFLIENGYCVDDSLKK